MLAAERLKIIGADEARRRLERTLGPMGRRSASTASSTSGSTPAPARCSKKSPYDGKPIPPILSCVDNGWLAAALIMVRNTYPALRERAEALLEPMDFALLLRPL